MNDIDLAPVLGEEGGFFHGRVSAANHGQWLVPKNGGSTVADCTSGNPPIPEATRAVAGAGEGQALGNGAGGDDDCIGQDGLGIGEYFEGSGGKIDPGDSFSEDLSAEAEGLGAAAIHDFITINTIRETGEVLNVGGGGELAAWSNVVGHPAFEEDGTELGPGGVEGGGVGCRTAADDAETGVEGFEIVHGGCGRQLGRGGGRE